MNENQKTINSGVSTVSQNGTVPQPERQIMKLSDAYLKSQAKTELELTVYNINWGYNSELMDVCRQLKEYARYVELVRKFAEKMSFTEAVNEAAFREGREEGREEGETRLAQLLQICVASGRNEDITRVLSDRQYREKLYQKNHL